MFIYRLIWGLRVLIALFRLILSLNGINLFFNVYYSPNDEVMEVQGVTRRGATGPSNQQGFDIDDSEFVAASEGTCI